MLLAEYFCSAISSDDIVKNFPFLCALIPDILLEIKHISILLSTILSISKVTKKSRISQIAKLVTECAAIAVFCADGLSI